MKVEFWGKSKPEAESESDPILRLSLITEPTRVLLIVTNGYGDPRTRGAILEITAEGTLRLFEGLAENLGLKLDENKCIRWEIPE